DDGDHWQSLRLNLPATSIRDLVVHQEDLVIGTHGRSFWILDDITPLRQINTSIMDSSVHLFAPQLTHRMRRNNNTDTPLPPETPAGQNPPDGAVVDYWLKSTVAGPIVLEIEDSSGKLVRRYSSQDKPDALDAEKINVPTYCVRPLRALSTQPGMHRFVWDLRYPPPDVLDRQYPISAIYRDTPLSPQGPAVLPGSYRVKLTVNGHDYVQPLNVKMDPRVKTSTDGLRARVQAEMGGVAALHRDVTALTEVRNLRAQLKERQQRAGKKPPASAIEALDRKAAELEGSTGGYGATFLSTAAGRSLARLNAGFSTLLSAIDSAD